MYARKVKDKTLTLQVSGMLWNRSLVMRDVETESLWSHILGKAMRGPLEGVELEALPGEMTTWSKWKQAHPETTVLNLSRTMKAYDDEFVGQQGRQRFVLGLKVVGQAYHLPWTTMVDQPILNATLEDQPLLVVFDDAGARVFDRRLDDRVFNFEPASDGAMRDKETGSTWTAALGEATDGPLKGAKLAHHVSIPSFTQAWMTFYPDSKAVPAGAAPWGGADKTGSGAK